MDIVWKNKNRTAPNHLRATSYSEAALFYLTLLLWTDRILLTYVRAFVMRLPIIGSIADYIITAVYAFLVLLSVPQIMKRVHAGDIFFLFITAGVCLLHYCIFPANKEVSDELLPKFLFLTFPLYFIGVSLDFERIYPWLYKLSLITIVAFTFYKLFVKESMTEVQSMYEGDMWNAYNILPHVCLVALAAFRKPGFVNWAGTVTGVTMISLLGSRGPLGCVVLTVAVYLILFKKYKNPIVAYCVIMIIAVVITFGLNTIVRFLYELAKSVGLSVRVFEKFFEGKISYSLSRDYIATQLYERISENPAFGYGIFADRVALGTYAHNIVIELWHAFGVVFGTVIFGGIGIVLLRAARIVKKVEQYAVLFLPLFFAGFVKLFLSNSFLEEIYLFWLLGIAVNLVRNTKKQM